MEDFDPQSTKLEGYGDLRLGREWVQITLTTILSVAVSATLLVCIMLSHVPDAENAHSGRDLRIQPASADACSKATSESE